MKKYSLIPMTTSVLHIFLYQGLYYQDSWIKRLALNKQTEFYFSLSFGSRLITKQQILQTNFVLPRFFYYCCSFMKLLSYLWKWVSICPKPEKAFFGQNEKWKFEVAKKVINSLKGFVSFRSNEKAFFFAEECFLQMKNFLSYFFLKEISILKLRNCSWPQNIFFCFATILYSTLRLELV